MEESIFWRITIFSPLNSIITSLNLIWTCVTESKVSKWLPAARANMRVMLTQIQTNDTFVPRVICTPCRKRESERLAREPSLSVTTSPAKWRGKTTNHSQICCCCSTAYQRFSPAWPRQYWRVMAVCYMIAFFIFSPSLTFLFALFYSSSHRLISTAGRNKRGIVSLTESSTVSQLSSPFPRFISSAADHCLY